MLKFLIAAALVIAGSVSAQKASYTYIGKGCTVPFDVSGTPKLGSTFHVRTLNSHVWCGNANVDQLFVLTGFSNKRAGPIQLPFDILVLRSVFGGAWCGHLRTSMDVVTPVPFGPYPPRTVSVSFPIPNAPTLIGLQFYQQVFWVSNYGECVVGDYYSLSRGGHGVIGT